MRCELRLRPSENQVAPVGLLLWGVSLQKLASWFSHHRGELATIYALPGGFLILSKQVAQNPFPGGLALQSLDDQLFFPVNAILSPALLPDEVRGVTRGKGLILLPHQRLIGFDLSKPLKLTDWLQIPAVRRSPWKSFPVKPQTASTLVRIERLSPPPGAILELLGGAPDDAKPLSFSTDGGDPPEDARPPQSSAMSNLQGQIGLKGGQLLSWLGGMTRIPGLSQMGADLAKKAIERVPRLTEKLLGAQEAALREVLRQLQSGDIEKGLRRAPIAVNDGKGGPQKIGTDSRLSNQSPFYSLGKLLGGKGGQGVAWLGGGNVWEELAREYRRLALEALHKGDFRRAAYLYGYLLKDLRSAANALMSGGLYQDAALLFRDKLNDYGMAATTFEKAGNLDEAIRLYIQMEKFETAAELLRNFGEEERARDLFLKKADRLIQAGRFLAAGDLVIQKLGDRSLAVEFYRKGWESGSLEAGNCGKRIFDHLFESENWEAIGAFVTEAMNHWGPESYTETGSILNYGLGLGAHLVGDTRQRKIKDQIQLHFATILRRESRVPGKRAEQVAGALFQNSRNWSGSQLRDATYAAGRESNRKKNSNEDRPKPVGVPLMDGPIRFAVISRNSRDLVLASQHEIIVWRPDIGSIQSIPQKFVMGQILGIATDPQAARVFVLTQMGHGSTFTQIPDGERGDVLSEEPNRYFLHLFEQQSGQAFALANTVAVDSTSGGTPWLQTETETGRQGQEILVDDQLNRYAFRASDLQPVKESSKETQASLTFSASDQFGVSWTWDQESIWFARKKEKGIQPVPFSPFWSAYWEPPGFRKRMRFDWIFPENGVMELAWIDSGGAAHWNRFQTDLAGRGSPVHLVLNDTSQYRDICNLGGSRLAALTVDLELVWLQVQNLELVSKGPRTRDLPKNGGNNVFLFACPQNGEVIVIYESGVSTRVSIPNP